MCAQRLTLFWSDGAEEGYLVFAVTANRYWDSFQVSLSRSWHIYTEDEDRARVNLKRGAYSHVHTIHLHYNIAPICICRRFPVASQSTYCYLALQHLQLPCKNVTVGSHSLTSAPNYINRGGAPMVKGWTLSATALIS